MKLPFLDEDEQNWRWQQPVFGRDRSVLHRVALFERRCNDQDPGGPVGVVEATTVCVLEAPVMTMPGLFSRMGATRCKRCCKLLGIPDGKGTPHNEEPVIVEPKEIRLPDRWGVFGPLAGRKRPHLAGPFRSKGAATKAARSHKSSVVLPIIEIPVGRVM